MLRSLAFLSILIILFSAVLAQAADTSRPAATALHVPDGAITIDGRDDDWQRFGEALGRCTIISDTQKLTLMWEPLFGEYAGPSDASLVVFTAHDSQYLYVLAQVHDQLLFNEATAEAPFSGDDFEIFIDAGPAANRFTTTKMPDYRQLIFLPGRMNQAFPQPLIWREKELPGVQAASRLRPWGYTIEVRIPAALFPNWLANPALDSIGFEVTTADCDTAGIDCHHAAVKSSCYALSPGQHHASAEHLALLQLEDTVTPQAAAPAAHMRILSTNQLCKQARTATAANAEIAAQGVLDALESKDAAKIAAAAVRSTQSLVRKAGLYVLFQRKELTAPTKQVQALLNPGAETPATLTCAEERVYAMLALAERGKLPVESVGAFYLQSGIPAPVKLSCLWALGVNGDSAAVAKLAPVLQHDPSYRARMVSALALGLLATPTALPALQEAEAKDADMYVRQQAKMAIEVIVAKQGKK